MVIKLEEVELFGLISTILGIAIFITVCFWDVICGRMFWRHSEGYGAWQILMMAGSGLYSMWGLSMKIKWAEYIKKIHKIGGNMKKVILMVLMLCIMHSNTVLAFDDRIVMVTDNNGEAVGYVYPSGQVTDQNGSSVGSFNNRGSSIVFSDENGQDKYSFDRD